MIIFRNITATTPTNKRKRWMFIDCTSRIISIKKMHDVTLYSSFVLFVLLYGFHFVSSWNINQYNYHNNIVIQRDLIRYIPTRTKSELSFSFVSNEIIIRQQQPIIQPYTPCTRGSSALCLIRNDDSNNYDNDEAVGESSLPNDIMNMNVEESTRRDMIMKLTKQFIATGVATLFYDSNMAAYAATNNPIVDATTTTAIVVATPSVAKTAPSTNTIINANDVTITHKVYFNIRISRSDGTFSVRDNSDDDEPYYAKLVIGLFGKNAPNHVDKFLSYIDNNNKEAIFDDDPIPSYSRSIFTKYDDATGLIYGGTIPSLDYIELNGNNVFKYGNRILPASLWLEKTSSPITHIGKGLLTHIKLDASPTFSITTRSDTTELDRSHTVFGRILLDETSTEFLSKVSKIPTYSIERPIMIDSTTTTSTSSSSSSRIMNDIVEDATGIIFNAQRELFRNAAKTLGDSRVSKVYAGKLLRRVEVTQVGMMQ